MFNLIRLAQIGVVAVGCLGAWAAIKFKYESQGVQKERARVEQKSNANAKKAEAARNSAERLPANRLCDKYARDC
jgi:Pyruvate/2-oxoacid:ferredoxin oxidoreductase gamma subunit